MPVGTTLRLQQLLAQLGYLPVVWGGRARRSAHARAELAAALTAPAGNFHWRYPNTPPRARAQWRPGGPSTITRGAVMMFEHNSGLAVDGIAGPLVWQALVADAMRAAAASGYGYVYVHRDAPVAQPLGRREDDPQPPGNTGVPAAPTQLGTFAVFEHITVGDDGGTNPDGSHYDDPGIHWISYFHGGDALHSFNRASYGTPQSLGCVELPLAAAAKVWPYTPIGTLVTIEN